MVRRFVDFKSTKDPSNSDMPKIEIRYGTGVVFWDLSLTKNVEKPFNMLAEYFGVKRLALHPGKFIPKNIQTSMKIVKIGVIYFNLELEKIKF